MNTIPYIAAFAALGWLAEFLLDDASAFLGNNWLGFAVIAIMAMLVPLTILAIQEDIDIVRARRK